MGMIRNDLFAFCLRFAFISIFEIGLSDYTVYDK